VFDLFLFKLYILRFYGSQRIANSRHSVERLNLYEVSYICLGGVYFKKGTY
jgi:hypothetical protein